MRILAIVSMTCLILLLSGCGQSAGEDVRLYNPELDNNCPRCDLRGAELPNANLSKANLNGANLSGANRTGARVTPSHLTISL